MKLIKAFAPSVLLIAVTIPWIMLLLLEWKYGVVAVHEPNAFILWGEVVALLAIIGVGVQDISHRIRAAREMS